MACKSRTAAARIRRAAHVDSLHDARVVERSLPCAAHTRRHDHCRHRACLQADAAELAHRRSQRPA